MNLYRVAYSLESMRHFGQIPLMLLHTTVHGYIHLTELFIKLTMFSRHLASVSCRSLCRLKYTCLYTVCLRAFKGQRALLCQECNLRKQKSKILIKLHMMQYILHGSIFLPWGRKECKLLSRIRLVTLTVKCFQCIYFAFNSNEIFVTSIADCWLALQT